MEVVFLAETYTVYWFHRVLLKKHAPWFKSVLLLV